MGNFQSVLKSLRKSNGLTQDELAKILKISRSTIGMYENGSREPDFETLERIADFFNVDTDFLLGRTDKTTILPENVSHYYLNDETRQIAQEAFENPELRTLFKVARDIPPERLKAHIEFMKTLKEQERGSSDDPC